MSQKHSVRSQPGYESKSKGWVPMGPERDVQLNSFDRTGYRVGGSVLGLGGIYCFAIPLIHRKHAGTGNQHEFVGEGMETYLGKKQEFTIRIDGDKLFQSGQLSDGLKIEEVWQR